MTRIEMWKQQVEWDIEDAKAEMEDMKRKIDRLVKSNNEHEIAEWLPTYSKTFAEAYKKMSEQEKTLRKIELVMKGA